MSESPTDHREMTLLAKLSAPEASAPPWSLSSALLTVAVIFICLIIIGPALASILLGSETISPSLLTLSWNLGMALTIIFVIVNRRSSHDSWRALSLGKGDLPSPIALLIGIAIALAIDLVVSLAGGAFLPIPELIGIYQAGTGDLIAAALLLVILQPVAETLVFQAVLLPSLRWHLGARAGVLTTSLLFTSLHLVVFSGANRTIYMNPWYDIAYPFLAGLAFCYLRTYSASSGAVFIARMGAGLIFLLTALVLTSR